MAQRVTGRRVLLATMLSLFAAIVVSCGVLDYSYPVAGEYRLWRMSADVIRITHDGPGKAGFVYPKIPDKVVALNWTERYVLAKQQHVTAEGRPVSRAYSWWVLDAGEHVAHGPLTEEAFGELRAKLGIDPNQELRPPTSFIPKEP